MADATRDDVVIRVEFSLFDVQILLEKLGFYFDAPSVKRIAEEARVLIEEPDIIYNIFTDAVKIAARSEERQHLSARNGVNLDMLRDISR